MNLSEIFTDEQIKNSIETYNLYVKNKDAFKTMYQEEWLDYNLQENFANNLKREIDFWAAKGKLELYLVDAIILAGYVFEKAVLMYCPPIVKQRLGESRKLFRPA